MADECPCLIPDEQDNCIDCGKQIDMPDVEAPNLGDIGGIVRLIDNTAKSYVNLLKANVDPANPTLPKLRLIGGIFVRLPHETLYKAVLGPSFLEAKKLGYRGTFEHWRELVYDATPEQHHAAL